MAPSNKSDSPSGEHLGFNNIGFILFAERVFETAEQSNKPGFDRTIEDMENVADLILSMFFVNFSTPFKPVLTPGAILLRVKLFSEPFRTIRSYFPEGFKKIACYCQARFEQAI